MSSFEPFTLLSALAQHTERYGLIATASTTFDELFHIARRFASLALAVTLGRGLSEGKGEAGVGFSATKRVVAPIELLT